MKRAAIALAAIAAVLVGMVIVTRRSAAPATTLRDAGATASAPPDAAPSALQYALDNGHVPAQFRRTPAPVSLGPLPTDGKAAHAWELDARRRALAGAWIVPASQLGTALVAMDFDGDRVRTWNGDVEKEWQLELDSPCELSLREKDGGYGFPFALRDGVAVFGMGAAGQLRGSDATVCDAALLVLDRRGCRSVWWYGFGDPEQRPARCALHATAGRTIFTGADPRWPDEKIELHADHDVLWDDELDHAHAEPVIDFATARALIDAQPMIPALRAGGRVGDTSTVAGLVATVGADRTATKGRTVEVEGVVLDTSAATMNGQTTYLLYLHAPGAADLFHPGVECTTPSGNFGDVRPDQVVHVRGVVDHLDATGVVTLQPCAIMR